MSKLKQRSQSPSLIDKLYELSANERSFIKLTQPEVVVQIKSLNKSDSEQKGAPAMSQGLFSFSLVNFDVVLCLCFCEHVVGLPWCF